MLRETRSRVRTTRRTRPTARPAFLMPVYTGKIEKIYDHDLIYVYSQLESGTELSLVREYDDPFDRHAVAVFHKSYRLGYLKAPFNRKVMKMLEEGKDMIAQVKLIETAYNFPIKGLVVSVFEKKSTPVFRA